MNIVRPIVWALRFLFELLALAAFAIGGWSLTSGPLRIALAIALPVIAAVVWGLWMAPIIYSFLKMEGGATDANQAARSSMSSFDRSDSSGSRAEPCERVPLLIS